MVSINAVYFFAALAVMFWVGYWRGTITARRDIARLILEVGYQDQEQGENAVAGRETGLNTHSKEGQ